MSLNSNAAQLSLPHQLPHDTNVSTAHPSAFASQGGIVPDAAGSAGQNNANAYRAQPPTRAIANSPAPIPVASVTGSAGASTSGTSASGAGGQSMTSVPLQEPQMVAPNDTNRR